MIAWPSRGLTSALLVVALSVTSRAQSDTVSPPRRLFTGNDALLAGGFIGLTLAAAPLDKYVAERLQNPRRQENKLLQRASSFVTHVAMPGAVIIGPSMYVIGRATGSHRAADLGLHGTEAIVLSQVVAMGLKGTFGRQRPYVDPQHLDPYNWKLFRGVTEGDGYRSFPSGHSVTAFAAAAAVTAEASRWWPDSRWLIGTAMYGGAGAVGLSRMYNNRHWASDVLMGAAIGTFAGNKVVRYHHSHPGNRVDEWLVNFSIAPTANGHALSASILPRLGPPIPRRR